MDNSTDWVVIGRFGRPHGIKGFVTINSFTDPRENILQYHDWHVYLAKQWQPLKLFNIESNVKLILAQVEGYQTREQVATLTNADIAVNRSQLPSLTPGEYYWHELIGMQVVNNQGYVFGKVTEIMPTGANDVLVVEGEKRYLIPYLPGQFIVDINADKQIITADWDVDF